MAITINGSGTITGISAGGLPDDSVTADDLADTYLTPTGDGSQLTGISAGFTVHHLTSGTSFSPKASSTNMYVAVFGSTGGFPGCGTNIHGGIGGAGFSEKLYTGSLSSSYSYSIGAGGVGSSGTNGGSTTFDVMTVTGGGGAAGTSGNTGGAGSGGDFNATGGTGGNSTSSGAYAYVGGFGGAGTRAGNGGNGANGDSGSSSGGGGGGTGGNNASGSTGGSAATSANASVVDLEAALGLPINETFGAGSDSSNYIYQAGITYTRQYAGGYGGASATSTSLPFITSVNRVPQTLPGKSEYAYAFSIDGNDGLILVIEW